MGVVKVTDDLFQHDDQSNEHHHEGETLDQSRGPSIVFQPLHPDRPARSTLSLCILTLALGCHDEPNLHLEFYRRTVTHCWNAVTLAEISQRVVTVAKKH